MKWTSDSVVEPMDRFTALAAGLCCIVGMFVLSIIVVSTITKYIQHHHCHCLGLADLLTSVQFAAAILS